MPDPYRASGGPADPGSWNRYSYVQGDPVNFRDPTGLATCRVVGESFLWDPYNPQATADVWCFSAGNTITPYIHIEGYDGNRDGLIQYLLSTVGAEIDRAEWNRTLGTLQSSARAISAKALWADSCVKDIESIRSVDGRRPSLGALVSRASELVFGNGLDNGYSGVQAKFESTPDQYALAPFNTNLQFWRPGYEVNKPVEEVLGAILHETLHNIGFGDDEIQLAFFGKVDPNGKTDNITQRLKDDCFK